MIYYVFIYKLTLVIFAHFYHAHIKTNFTYTLWDSLTLNNLMVFCTLFCQGFAHRKCLTKCNKKNYYFIPGWLIYILVRIISESNLHNYMWESFLLGILFSNY